MTTHHVFLVDDDPAVRKALARLIRSAGIIVETFDSAYALLEKMTPGTRGVIISDIEMPGLDGLELQQRLSQTGHHLPFIFITAYENFRTRERALGNGAVRFLQKPINDDSLFDAIDTAFRMIQ